MEFTIYTCRNVVKQSHERNKPFALLEVRRMIFKLKVKGNTHLHTVALMLRFWSVWTCHNEQVRSRKLHGNSVMTWAHHCRCSLEYSYVSLTIVIDEHWSRICPPCEYWMFLTLFQTPEECLICCSNVYVCLSVCLLCKSIVLKGQKIRQIYCSPPPSGPFIIEYLK